MSGKERLSKSISTGVVVLVFILLTIQLAFFALKIIGIYRVEDNTAESVVADNSVQEIISVESSHKTNNSKGGANSTNESTTPHSKSTDTKNIKSSAVRVEAQDSSTLQRAFALEPLPPKPIKPKIDINSADSALLVTLYGIGPYFAKKIIEFREKLGGSYASTEQLMDIWGLDSAKYVRFKNQIYVDRSRIKPIDLYTIPLDSMATHPYIGKYAAKGIVRYREMVAREQFSIDALIENGIISKPYAQRLRLYSVDYL